MDTSLSKKAFVMDRVEKSRVQELNYRHGDRVISEANGSYVQSGISASYVHIYILDRTRYTSL